MSEQKLDIELGLISKVVETGDIKEAIKRKITTKFFYGSGKLVWEYIRKHYHEYKVVPSLEVLKREFPDFEVVSTEQPAEYFIDELQHRQQYNLILQGMQRISGELKAEDPQKAMKELARLVSKVNTEVVISRDVLWNEEIEERIERLDLKRRTFGVDGIPYGIEPLDNATGGMHPAELITIVGKPGTGKTYFELACIALPALRHGEDVLFISREMEDWQIQQRLDSIFFEIPADKMKRGLFTDEEFEAYKKLLEGLKNEDLGRFIVSADDEKGFGLTAIQAKIEEHLPNGGVVIIDGSYLLDDDEDNGRKSQWEKISSITRGLKRMARRTQCTIAQSSQLGRGQKRGKSVDLDNISFSSSFEQDSDVVIGLSQTDEMKEAGKMRVEGVKVREGNNPVMILNWNFDTMKDFGKLAEDITDVPDDDEDIIY